MDSNNSLLWSDSWMIGVDKIDAQHKELFDRINALLTAMKNGKGKTEVLSTLDFLEEYVNKHFTDDEEIQKKNNYPRYAIQHQEHEEFREQLKQLRKTFEETGLSTMFVINVQNSMTNWWRKHILELDKDLGSYLNTQKKQIV